MEIVEEKIADLNLKKAKCFIKIITKAKVNQLNKKLLLEQTKKRLREAEKRGNKDAAKIRKIIMWLLLIIKLYNITIKRLFSYIKNRPLICFCENSHHLGQLTYFSEKECWT